MDKMSVEDSDEKASIDHEQARKANLAFYASLEQFISVNLSKLAKMLNDQSARLQGQEDQFRFLYFNHMNLALKTSLSAKSSPLNMDTIRLIRSIHADFITSQSKRHDSYATSEVCVKTKTSGWVVGRRANQSQREFFVLIDEKIGNLSDIQEEVDRLAKIYFYNIFIH